MSGDTERKIDRAALAEARNVLGGMSRFFKVFENAQLAVDVLANAEQVARELDAAIAAKRQELDGAGRDVAAARDTARTLEAQAKAMLAEAEEKAEQLARGAKLAATEEAEAQAVRRDDGERQLVAQAAALELNTAAIAAQRAELAELEGKLAAAKDAVRRALGGELPPSGEIRAATVGQTDNGELSP